MVNSYECSETMANLERIYKDLVKGLEFQNQCVKIKKSEENTGI